MFDRLETGGHDDLKSARQLVDILRRCVAEEAGGSQARWAREHNVQTSLISAILSGARAMTPQIASTIGYSQVVLWKKRGR